MFGLLLAVHTFSAKQNVRYVGGEGKEDEIIVWFRVRKWACEEEEEEKRSTFLIFARLRQQHILFHTSCDSSILNVILCLGFNNRFNTFNWMKNELVVEQQRHGKLTCAFKDSLVIVSFQIKSSKITKLVVYSIIS